MFGNRVSEMLCFVKLGSDVSQELKARSSAKVAYLKTERLQPVLVGSLFVCRAKGLLAKRFGVVAPRV